MEVGIVGLPGVGKTSLFNALTGGHAKAFEDKAHVGVANIPDLRLGLIAQHITTKKIIPATIRLVDIPGVPVGGDAKKLNVLLEQIRQVDAICQVVRAFDDGTGVIDAPGDIDKLLTELVLADLLVVDGATDKAKRTARSGDKDAQDRLALLEKVCEVLDGGRPARAIDTLTPHEQQLLRGYGLITAKPQLVVFNIAEDDLSGDGADAVPAQSAASAADCETVAVCAKLEAELAELDEADRAEMLESLGLAEPAIGPLARAANACLGLTTFYTAGDKEVRAWAIPLGASAPDAAGAIHSDIQRGFIRAECYHVDDLVRYKSEKAIRDAGKLRSEGKHYAMADGDVVHFLFNV